MFQELFGRPSLAGVDLKHTCDEINKYIIITSKSLLEMRPFRYKEANETSIVVVASVFVRRG